MASNVALATYLVSSIHTTKMSEAETVIRSVHELSAGQCWKVKEEERQKQKATASLQVGHVHVARLGLRKLTAEFALVTRPLSVT